MLIKKAYDSLKPNGMVIVADYFIEDSRDKRVETMLQSIHLQNVGKGPGFTYKDVGTWMEEAGFKDVKVDRMSDIMDDAMIGFKH